MHPIVNIKTRSIVITGSTRGVGYSLATAFLECDCAVTISGRTQESVNKAVGTLAAKYNPELIFGFPCDVTDFTQVQSCGRMLKLILAGSISGPTMPGWPHP